MDVGSRKTIGSRELKTRLGTYLRQVKAGASLVVTDHGLPVAELRPVKQYESNPEARLRELATLGILSGDVAERAPLRPFKPIRSRGASLSEAIREDREDRF